MPYHVVANVEYLWTPCQCPQPFERQLFEEMNLMIRDWSDRMDNTHAGFKVLFLQSTRLEVPW